MVFFALSCQFLSAQCPGNPPLTLTYESTESRCESNGTITLHIAGGTPFTDTNGNPIYNNTIIAPIVIPVGGQSDSIFSALASDTYTVEVADANGCTVTANINVPGDHMQMELDITFKDAICAGATGGWICGTPAEGRPFPPGYYEYQLYDASTNPPTPIGVRGLDSCFMNLVMGSYQIRAFDSCNNFQTRDVIIGEKPKAQGFGYLGGRTDISCTKRCWSFRVVKASGDNPPEYPIDWVVTASDDPALLGKSGAFTGTFDSDSICWSPAFKPGSFTITYTDQCGVTDTRQWGFGTHNYGGGVDFSCTSGFFVSFSKPSFCPQDSMNYQMYEAPVGVPISPPQTSGTFTNLQQGLYRWEITDCCGNVSSHTSVVSGYDFEFRPVRNNQYACENGYVSFRNGYSFSKSNPVGDEMYIYTSAPAGYSVTLPDTLEYWDRVEGPPGIYCITIIDDCLNSVDTCITIGNPLFFEYESIVTLACVTGNSIQANLTQNGGTILDVVADFTQIAPVYNQIQQNLNVFSWSNLTAGTYVVLLENDDYNCDLVADTIVIPGYIQPSIEGSWGIECDNGVGLITVVGSHGTPPYTYELYQGPVTRPLQSTPDFPGLPLGTYDIRIYDDCGNSEITTQAIEPFMPVIQGYGGYFCEGDTAFLYSDFLSLANYNWSGPNGHTSDTSVLMIPNITMADAGTYTITIDVKNPDQTACIAQTLTIDIDVYDCNCSIDQISSTDVSCGGNGDGSATVLMDGGAPPYTYNWSNGGNTPVVSNLGAGVYTVTVTDVRGCAVVDMVTINEVVPMSVTPYGTTPDCANIYNGTLNVNVVGGTTPYSFLWNTGATSQSVGGIGAGSYTVTVTDTNNCSVFNTVILSEPAPLLAVVSVMNAACPTSTDGSATVNATGGTPGYTYQWDSAAGGQTTASVSGLMAGTYGVTILDDNLCEYLVAVTIGADDTQCVDECPDLTPIITILPGNIAGVAAVGIAIEITELNGFDTDGTTITVRVPSDPRLTFIWDPGLTSVAFTNVNNADWNYLGDNGFVHLFEFTGPTGVIAASGTEAFGMEATYDPQSTDGQTTITSTIIPFSGGECNILNNTDSERLVYFQ